MTMSLHQRMNRVSVMNARKVKGATNAVIKLDDGIAQIHPEDPKKLGEARILVKIRHEDTDKFHDGICYMNYNPRYGWVMSVDILQKQTVSGG